MKATNRMLGNRIYYWFWSQDQIEMVDSVLFTPARCELIDPKYIPSNVWCQCQHSIDISRNSIGNVTFHFFVFPVKKSISDGSPLPLPLHWFLFQSTTTFNQQWARLYCRYILLRWLMDRMGSSPIMDWIMDQYLWVQNRAEFCYVWTLLYFKTTRSSWVLDYYYYSYVRCPCI